MHERGQARQERLKIVRSLLDHSRCKPSDHIFCYIHFKGQEHASFLSVLSYSLFSFILSNFTMLARQIGIPARRISGPVNRALRLNHRTPLATTSFRIYAKPLTRNLLPVVAIRSYANGRRGPVPPGGTHKMDMGGGEEKSALEQYGVDLTERAREGKLDPVIGRDAEIHRTIQVLSRRTKNNPGKWFSLLTFIVPMELEL